jgi:hypothetical protein
MYAAIAASFVVPFFFSHACGWRAARVGKQCVRAKRARVGRAFL